MSDRLSDEDLDLLEGLHVAATPGPWWGDTWGDVTARLPGGSVVISESPGNQVHAVAIAAAHNALPDLLAEVREHRAREAAYRAALDALVDGDGR